MVQVTFIQAGAFFASLVVATLLVGIIPPLVNRPPCKPKDSLVQFHSGDVIVNNKSDSINSLLYKIESSKNLQPKIKKRSMPKGDYVNNFYYKKHHLQRSEVYEDCREIVSPTPGQTYPWENNRLTLNVIPIHYDIELFVPNYDQREFNGLITIMFEIVENATDTFIVHSRNNAVEVFTLQDKNDEYIDISCAIEYPENEYFVFKTSQLVQPASSPLKVQYFFDGEIDSYESGIFQADFLINNQKTYFMTKTLIL